MYMLLLYEYVEQVQVLSWAIEAIEATSRSKFKFTCTCTCLRSCTCKYEVRGGRTTCKCRSCTWKYLLESTCKCCSTCTKRTAVVYRRTWYSHSGVLGTPIVVYLALAYWCPIGPNKKQHKEQYDLYSMPKDINKRKKGHQYHVILFIYGRPRS